MNKSNSKNRAYTSRVRADAADETRKRILKAAKALFGRKGIHDVTIADIGKRAGVAGSTVYAVFKSKSGIIRALMEQSLFGGPYRSAQKLLEGVDDPVRLIALTPRVSRAIYESETGDLGLLRNASGFSPELRKIEVEFERMRYDMQEERVRKLFDSGRARKGLPLEEARRILWLYTSRDIYRMLVTEGGWSGQRYQDWLTTALLDALVEPGNADPPV
jgi:AcrR family transcriptional regulator